MTPDRFISDYLRDILDSIDKIELFTKGMSFEEFKADNKTSFAVIRALEIIGEAAKCIPENFYKEYKQVPWREVAGMRDKLIHAYFGVDLEVVWRTISEDLSLLRDTVKIILDKEK